MEGTCLGAPFHKGPPTLSPYDMQRNSCLLNLGFLELIMVCTDQGLTDMHMQILKAGAEVSEFPASQGDRALSRWPEAVRA